MKAANKNNWMVWAIAVLAIMNLATLITIVYHKNNSSDKELVVIPDQSQSESTSVNYSGRYFKDELNLSGEQMKSFSEFNPEFRRNVMAINQSLDMKRHEMLVEMAEENCDTNRLNLLSDSIGYLHARLKKQTYLYYLDFKRICNEEQQKKLEQLFGEIFNSDIQMVKQGRGVQGGRRYGRQTPN
ncbi:MAG: hypothetical protein IPJ37_08040 [Bacteroidales bacterium]|nr:hypothetical protein [Bacteroidales bacterium]